MANGAALTADCLTNEEASFVYNVEVLQLPVAKAAELAQLPYSATSRPHVMEAREAARRKLVADTRITKEDVVQGVRDAINRAKLISEPATEIRGWEVISKLLGLDAPTRIDVNMRESITVIQQQARRLTDAQLVDLLGAGAVIDGDFYITDASRG